MAESQPAIFFHLHKADGSIGSICRNCLVLIATKSDVSDLRELEDAHLCSVDEARVSTVIEPMCCPLINKTGLRCPEDVA